MIKHRKGDDFMRKSIFFLCLLILILPGCSFGNKAVNPGESQASYISDFPEYEYKGEMKTDFNGRTFLLEDAPENIVEELAVFHYYFNFAGDYEKLWAITGENEGFKIALENEEKYAKEGNFIYQKNIIHDVSLLSPDDLQKLGDYFIDYLAEDVDKFGLSAYSVVKLDLTWEYTEEYLTIGAQLDSGRYVRLLLLGKTSDLDDWKIYDIYWGEYL